MNVLLFTSGICAVKMVLPFFIKWILSYVYKTSPTEILLQREARDMRQTLDSLSMVDEFAKCARLQRRLNKTRQDLMDATNLRLSHRTKIQMTINYAVQIIYALIILFTVWNYKYSPTIVLPAQWTVPLESVLRWPTGVEGGISISMWLLMLESTSKIISANFSY